MRDSPRRPRNQFSRVILEVSFDYPKQLAFGILYIEEKLENVPALLKMDFDKYFIPIQQNRKPATV
jgi:hypothetical protein